MKTKNQCDGIYIMGQTERTGTNFLARLLLEHADVAKAAHPGEDRLVMKLEHLEQYIQGTSAYWSNSWSGMDKTSQQQTLLDAFRSCLLHYLTPEGNAKKFVLTKSPSTLGIQYFDTFFPTFKLIILVRDGRNVVESLFQSFGKGYTDSMRQWASSASRIIEYMRSRPETSFLLVRYEELNDNTESELNRILHFLELTPDRMNWKNIKDIPIIGSSQSSETVGKVDWSKKLTKTDNFAPNSRYKNWTWLLKRKYNRICGKRAQDLKYETF